MAFSSLVDEEEGIGNVSIFGVASVMTAGCAVSVCRCFAFFDESSSVFGASMLVAKSVAWMEAASFLAALDFITSRRSWNISPGERGWRS